MQKIRLTRVGKKHSPHYRVVVTEHTAPVKGKFIEILGHYHPAQKDKLFVVNKERVLYYLSKGAQVSPTVNNLLADHDVIGKDKKIKVVYAKKKETAAEEKEKEPAAEAVKTEVEAKEKEEKVQMEAAEAKEKTADQTKEESPAESTAEDTEAKS